MKQLAGHPRVRMVYCDHQEPSDLSINHPITNHPVPATQDPSAAILNQHPETAAAPVESRGRRVPHDLIPLFVASSSSWNLHDIGEFNEINLNPATGTLVLKRTLNTRAITSDRSR